MTKRKTVQWNPQWTPEELKKIDELTVDMDRRIESMRAFREQLGLSQTELAEILGVSQSNVSKIEKSAQPRLSVLRKLIEHKGGKLRIVAEFDGKETDLSFL